MSPQQALSQFLASSFTTSLSLCQWVYLHLPHLRDTLSEAQPLGQVATVLVELVDRRDEADAPFFTALRGFFPKKESELRAIETAWLAGRAASLTAKVLDRIHQWSTLRDWMRSDEHFVVLLHGDREASVQQFMERIERDLKPMWVGTGHDVNLHATAGDWLRDFVRATGVADSRRLATALAEVSAEPLFLVHHRRAPLSFHNLRQARGDRPLRALGEFLRRDLRDALASPLVARKVRVVVPFEHEVGADLTPLDPLRAVLREATQLRVHELALTFPKWEDVGPSLREKMRGVDAETVSHCKQIYDEVAARPGRTLTQLGNELHDIIHDWLDTHA